MTFGYVVVIVSLATAFSMRIQRNETFRYVMLDIYATKNIFIASHFELNM